LDFCKLDAWYYPQHSSGGDEGTYVMGEAEVTPPKNPTELEAGAAKAEQAQAKPTKPAGNTKKVDPVKLEHWIEEVAKATKVRWMS
jgi:hypothetical protein